MFTTPRFLSAPAARLLAAALLLTAAASCKKKEDPAPSNTTLLTTPTWRMVDARLTINGVEGVYTPAASDVVDTKFTADGKFTSTPATGTATTGTWAFASNETQLVQTSGSSASTDPYQIFTLTSTDLVIGYNTYTQAQVQHAIDNNNTTPTATDRTILTLIFASSSFKFPNNTPPVSNASQITSISFRSNYKAR